MKRKSFLIFTAIIIIAVAICIIIGFKANIMTSSIIGYVCCLAINAGIMACKEKNSEEQNMQADKNKENLTVGGGIGIGIGIGAFLAFFGFFVTFSSTVAEFLFIGSVLGAVVGLMYKD